jgi:thiaminase/transcriptional activator TenA
MMSLTCQTLLNKYADAWQGATRHRFLDDCKTGAILPQQFNTWLVQDYLFVVEFTRMVARLLSVATVPDFDNLLGGLQALKDELNWFREKAAERGLDLGTAKQQTCRRYCEFMDDLARESYAVQAVSFWAIELAYNQAWQLPGPMVPPYDEFADRWGNPGFTAYVELLEQQADKALAVAAEQDLTKAAEMFLLVADLEKHFWQMAFAGADR